MDEEDHARGPRYGYMSRRRWKRITFDSNKDNVASSSSSINDDDESDDFFFQRRINKTLFPIQVNVLELLERKDRKVTIVKCI